MKKKIQLLIIAGAGVLGIALLIAILSLAMSGSKRERDAVIEALSVEQQPESAPQELPEPVEGEEPSPAAEAEEGQDALSQPEKENGGEESEDPASVGEDQKVSVGALDDAQDPQASLAAGNGEGTGAEVNVANISPDETEGITVGIDVSKYQGTVDWQKVKNAGIDFAMIRVGYRAKSTGELFEDPTARYNLQEAQKAGIMLGAYFFSSAVTTEEAKAEAAFTKDIIAKYKITYPVAYNCEDFLSSDSRQYGLDSAARTNLAMAFLDEIAQGGYTPMFYAAKGELEGSAQWDTQALSGKYKIWVAQYPELPYPETQASSYGGSHDMWQYTSQGVVDGITKKTDVNLAYFSFTKEALAKDETPAEVVEADPEVGIIFTEVNETVTAKQETNLRTEPSTVNDESIMGKLVHGDTAQRTGIGHNGWSRLIYNGQTCYAVTNYLTTDMNDTGQQAPPQGPVYTPVNDTVTAKDETNLRSEPGTGREDTIVGVLRRGETLTRIGIGDNGWSQLEYNGQTVYAVTSYLTTPE